MASDNIDILKKIIFRIPSVEKIFLGSIALSVIYSILTFLGLKMFTSISLEIVVVPFIAVFLFIIPTLTSGELLHRFIPEYPRKWGYFLAFCNLNILFIYSMILTGADNFLNAWNVLWIGIMTVYLSNFFVLMLTIGYKYIKRISVLSLVQPIIILVAFHIFLGRFLQVPLSAYFTNFSVLIVTAFIIIFAFLLAEFFIRANVPNISVINLIAGLLQKRQEALDLGYPTKTDVQTLQFENETSRAQVAIPWIHPGPIEGFGGGKITSKIIDYINQDIEGFFFHVPSTHKSDPTNPEDYRKVLEAMEEPETYSKASKLLKRRYGDVKLYGRKFNGEKIVFMDSPYDDYELSIFREILDLEDTILVDLHNQERELQGDREEVWYNTETANLLRNYLLDFLDELEEQSVHDYKVGFKSYSEKSKIFSLIEEVEGQKTILFGIEGNEAGPELQQLEKEYSTRFDETLTFTTDTHRSIHELSREKQVEPDLVRKTIKQSSSNLSKGRIGFTTNKTETMKLLQEDYSGMIFSFNILIRLIPLTLVLLYVLLIVWFF